VEMHLIEFALAERLLVLIAVPLLLWIGYQLFVLGVTGKMTVAGSLKNGWGVKATQVAPGSFCFILGVALGIYILHTTGFAYEATLHQTTQDGSSTQTPPAIPQTKPTTQLNSSSSENIPPKASTVTKPTEKAETLKVYGLQGSSSALLSTRIRYALSEALICTRAKPNLPTQDANACEDTYFSHFSHIPSQAEIDRIEQEERSAAANDSKAIKALQDEANALEVH
jgi:hypothetical protein